MKIACSFIISIIALQSVCAQVKIESAETVLKQAYNEAADNNKNVFVIFHASWCGWCHKFDSSMNDASCKKYFNDNYVIRHLRVYENTDEKSNENPGAEDLLKKYNGAGQGIPYFLIFDKNGTLLADSKVRDQNIGCPAAEEEVRFFSKILEKTSKLTKPQLAVIEKRFAKNNL